MYKDKQRNIDRSIQECNRRRQQGICRCCDHPVCMRSLVFCEKHLIQHSDRCKARLSKLPMCVRRYRVIRNRKKHLVNITEQAFVEWYNSQEMVCCYCGISEELLSRHHDKKKQHLTVDRMDSGLGYFVGNICLACFRCNNSKSDFFTHDQWKIIAEQFIKPNIKQYHRHLIGDG